MLGCSSAPLDDQASGHNATPNVGPDAEPESAKATVSVALLNGNTFAVYEPVLGDVLYSETGKQGIPRTDIQSLNKSSVRALLESLPLAEAVPDSVDDVDRRQVAFRAAAIALQARPRPVNKEPNTSISPHANAFEQKLS